MPTVTRNLYIAIAGEPFATRALNLHGFGDLLTSPKHRIDPYSIPGVDGDTARTAVRSSLRALCDLRVDGRWDHTTDSATADPIVGAYTAWQVVHDIADTTDLQTLQLYVDGSEYATAQCQVIELTAPTLVDDVPYLWDAKLDLWLPDGALL